jgi:hypothetical protein
MRIRRICLFAGPGAGKSVAAARLFAELKIGGLNVELVSEYIKAWAYKKIVPKSFDQYYIFGKQLHAEDVYLSNGADLIVTDSPLFMQLSYMVRSGLSDCTAFVNVLREFDAAYPALNLFLDRSGIEYKGIGRYENYGQACEMDNRIISLLDELGVDYQLVKSVAYDEMLKLVRNKLEANG